MQSTALHWERVVRSAADARHLAHVRDSQGNKHCYTVEDSWAEVGGLYFDYSDSAAPPTKKTCLGDFGSVEAAKIAAEDHMKVNSLVPETKEDRPE